MPRQFTGWWTGPQQQLAIELSKQGLELREIGLRLAPPRSTEAVRKKLGELARHARRSLTGTALQKEVTAAKREASDARPYKHGPLAW